MTTETPTTKKAKDAWITRLRADAVQWIAGWVNPLTGQGDPSKDKSSAGYWMRGMLLQHPDLVALFTFNALARAICMALPEWSMRNGWDLTLDRDAVKSQEIESAVRARWDDLGASEVMLRGAVWGQTFGGGLVLVGANDGRETHDPLDEGNIQSIDWLRVVPRHRVQIVAAFDAVGRPGFGEPALYDVQEIGASTVRTTRYHASRVIVWPGPITDDDMKRENAGWDQSILDVVVSALRKHDGMWDDVGAMTKDGSQAVWKIQGLADAAVAGLMEHVQARIQVAELVRSVFGAIMLDAKEEDFAFVSREFGGISDLLGQSAVRTAGAAQMPVTVLMGQSPAGLNATGESDLELWYARVEAFAATPVTPRVERLVRLILLAKDGPTQGKEPDTWAVKMRDPRKLSPMKRKELEARQAQIDASMIASKVVTPEEVAISRYTSEGWSEVTQLDLGWRRDFVERMRKRFEERAEELAEALLERWLALAPEGVQGVPGAGDGGALPANASGSDPAEIKEPSGTEAPQDINKRAADRADVPSASSLVHAAQLADAAGLRFDAHDGCMIAVRLPSALAAELALEGGEPPETLHLTLAYLGRTGVLDADVLDRAGAVVRSFASRTRALEATVGGIGRFAASPTTKSLDVLVALVDAPGLGAMRAALVAELERAQVPVSQAHDFMPHVTLAYLPAGAPLPVQSIAGRSFVISAVHWYVGGRRQRYELEGRG